MTLERRWPVDEIDALVGPMSDREFALRAGVTRRTVQRWRHEGGVPDSIADRTAIRFGYHPTLIWPRWNDHVSIDEPEVDQPKPTKTAAPNPQPKQETAMNINDIFDANEQLEQLLTRIDYSTLVELVERLGSRAPARPAEPVKMLKQTKQTKSAKVTAIGGGRSVCTICDLRFGPRAFGNHMRQSHWDDVIEVLAAEGTKGLLDAYGITPKTATAWAAEIGRAAA